MNKEFVPYEEALELKELGFDEPCFGEYRQWDGNEPWLQLYQDLDGCSTDPVDYEYTLEAKAPTFSQAFRWFREKYGLFSEIQPYLIIGTQWRYTITNRNNSSGLPHKEGFQTYEEAELACLRELIEIVKKEKQ